jgi:hypothetical protein
MCRLWGNVEKYRTTIPATDDNTIRCTRLTHWITKATNIRSKYLLLCFSTATVVTRTCFNFSSYVHFLSWYSTKTLFFLIELRYASYPSRKHLLIHNFRIKNIVFWDVPACSVVEIYQRLRLELFQYFNKLWVRLIQKQVRSKPKEAQAVALRSQVFTEEKWPLLCDVMLRSLLDMLLQHIGTYLPKHTASHFRT